MGFFGITSRNPGQKETMEVLLNDKPFLFLTGEAGTGKTLITQAVGLHRTLDRKQFARFVYTRMQTQLGSNTGFLPGDLDEKTYPFVRPFFDNLGLMSFNEKQRAAVFGLDNKRQKVFFDPIQTLRGGTFHKSFIMVDEAQNLDPGTIAGVATRIAQGSKMVFCGNFAQIDEPRLRIPENNGFYQLLNGLYEKDETKYFDHITLTEQERNPVVSVVEDILRNNTLANEFQLLELKGWCDNEFE